MDTHSTSKATPSAARRLTLSRLKAAAAREREVKEELIAAEELMQAEIETARDLGVTWAKIAEATGLTEAQAQWRTHKFDPSVREAQARKLVPEESRQSTKGRTRPGRGPGLSVTEYARQRGLTRRAIYLQIDAGKLQTERNELGQIRVIADMDGQQVGDFEG